MNILEEYSIILQRILELKDDIDIKNSDLQLNMNKLNAIQDALSNAIRLRDGDNRVRINRAVDELKASIDNEYRFKIASLQQKIQMQHESMDNETRSKIQFLKNHDTGLKEIAELEKKLQVYNGFSVLIDNSLKCPQESFDELKKRVADLKSIDELQIRKQPLTNNLLHLLSGKQLFDGIENPKLSICAMTAYVVILAAITLAIPQVTLLAYSALTLQSAFSSDYNESNLEICRKTYSLCSMSIDRYKELFSKELNKKIKKTSSDIENKYFDKISSIEDSISDLESKRESEKSSKDNLLCDIDFKNKVLADLIDNVSLLENDLKEAESDVSMSKKEVNTFNETNAELIRKKDELQKQITEDYICNLVPGDSVVMVDKLFLGFNSDDSLITIDNPGTSNLILYSGNTSDLIELASLILVQIFKSFDISISSVKIVDVSSIGASFQVFNADDLQFVTEIITTEADFDSSICKGTYESLPIKNRKILSKADNIHNYNIEMRNKNSLPMEFEYHIVIDGGKKMFDSRYVKLCKDGKISGVYPFVFLSLQQIRDELGKDKPNSEFLKGASELLSAMEDWYNYVPSQNSFNKLGKEYSNNLINDIKKKLINSK